MSPIDTTPINPNEPLKRKPVSYKNLLLGASKLNHIFFLFLL